MFLSWFDFAHHDPEQAVEGSGVQFRPRLDSRFSRRLIPASQFGGLASEALWRMRGNDGLQSGNSQ